MGIHIALFPFLRGYRCQWGTTGDNQTRFLSRWLADYDPPFGNKIGYNLFLEPVGFVMGRKMLIGTKQRAERE